MSSAFKIENDKQLVGGIYHLSIEDHQTKMSCNRKFQELSCREHGGSVWFSCIK